MCLILRDFMVLLLYSCTRSFLMISCQPHQMGHGQRANFKMDRDGSHKNALLWGQLFHIQITRHRWGSLRKQYTVMRNTENKSKLLNDEIARSYLFPWSSQADSGLMMPWLLTSALSSQVIDYIRQSCSCLPSAKISTKWI